ncbi:hypothetical protein NET02_01995 [Thermomicrobiaceae bacterium CFH 74404]|uniref:YkoP-like domain-containing protein n=1 Tax=Thermalbibacter longus TaxID=2951981 RepID=A0AA41WD79_9BACT|nr:hypothetical protein [Thermalbibacter longus]MCM8747913.1 hypothetical protein [Thermalbibacter longus]
MLSVWLGWERLTHWWWHTRPLGPGGIFRYRLLVYTGLPVTLRDGCTVRPGHRIIDLHFDNRRLLRAAVEARDKPWSLLRAAREDLQTLASLVGAGELGEVRALRGVTLFARAGRRLGFEARPLPVTGTARLQRYFFVGLLAVYHPRGWQAAERFRERGWPGEAWMSRERLLDLYAARRETTARGTSESDA